mmetsp:Transcript_9441/g.10357  ORF Transcript_9441/g.10357 Transcript_9441/m.10357 type:complete len:465 (-) Transcript_9441:55-1449(-)
MNAIKVQFQEWISRIGEKPTTVEHLRTLSREAFANSDSFPVVPNFQYTDPDGDVVTIASDRDLVEAYSVADSMGKQVLKLMVVKSETSVPTSVVSGGEIDTHPARNQNDDESSDDEDELDHFDDNSDSDEEGELIETRDEEVKKSDPQHGGMEIDNDHHHHHHHGHGRGHGHRGHGRHGHRSHSRGHEHGDHHGRRGDRFRRGRGHHHHHDHEGEGMEHDHGCGKRKERRERKKDITPNQKATIKTIKRDGKNLFDAFEFPAGRSEDCRKLWKMVGRVSLFTRRQVVDLVLSDSLNVESMQKLAEGHARDIVCKRRNPEVPEMVEEFRVHLLKMFTENLPKYQTLLKEGDPLKGKKKNRGGDGSDTVVRSEVAKFVFGLLDKKGCHVRWAIRGKIGQNYCLQMTPEELQQAPVVNYSQEDWENKPWEVTCEQVYTVLVDTYPDKLEAAEDVKQYMLQVGAKAAP